MSDPVGKVAGTHELVTVTGPGAAVFLQGILSQDVEVLDPASARRSFLLGPQGKLRALLWIAREEDRFELFTDAGFGSVVAGDLAHYKIRVKAEISEPVPVSQLIGVDRGVIPGRIDAPMSGPQLGTILRSFTTDPPNDLPAISIEQWTALRIEGGEPVMGLDVDDKTIPQESGLVAEAVSFTKGCYLGQELVARIDTRGRVNRHLRGVLLSGPALPSAAVTAQAGEVGVLTSTAWSDRLSAHIGLALLQRTVAPGDTVEAGGVVGEVVALPF